MQFVQNFANIRKYSQIVLTNKSHSGVAMQGSKNCGSRKWRQRGEVGGKNTPKRANNGVFALDKVKSIP